MGISKKLSDDIYNNAIKDGLFMEDFDTRPTFQEYLKTMLKPNCDCIIYNRYIIVCSKFGDIAVTILNVPKEYYSTIESVKKRKRKKEEGCDINGLEYDKIIERHSIC